MEDLFKVIYIHILVFKETYEKLFVVLHTSSIRTTHYPLVSHCSSFVYLIIHLIRELLQAIQLVEYCFANVNISFVEKDLTKFRFFLICKILLGEKRKISH